MIRDACIVGMAGQFDSSGTGDFRMRINDSSTATASLSVSAATGAEDGSVNVDLLAGDALQCFIEATTAVEDPCIVVEIAWRL